jgi:hypothetical protein
LTFDVFSQGSSRGGLRPVASASVLRPGADMAGTQRGVLDGKNWILKLIYPLVN